MRRGLAACRILVESGEMAMISAEETQAYLDSLQERRQRSRKSPFSLAQGEDLGQVGGEI
jgi:hypothetical protein